MHFSISPVFGCLFLVLHVRSLLQKSFSHGRQLGFPIATLGKPSALFPSAYSDGGGGGAPTHYTAESTDAGAPRTAFHRHHHQQQHHHHDANCPRYSARFAKERSRSLGAMETSIASLHSSGKDSGIADGIQCQCGLSTSHSSDESSK